MNISLTLNDAAGDAIVRAHFRVVGVGPRVNDDRRAVLVKERVRGGKERLGGPADVFG